MADTEDGGERIAKVLARAGVASRREAERMIEAGRVSVNGRTLDTPAFKVSREDDVRVDGKPVGAPEPTKLWLYHKPDGLVTTHKDPEGRTTVFEKLPREIGRVISIGRLDLTSEGLLLLTNDGALARALELPSTGWTRRYRARAWGDMDEAAIARLRAGVTVEGVRYGPIEAEVENRAKSNVWLKIALKEGKNREVRKALDAVGLRVNRLIRTAYGPFQLGALEPGEIKAVPERVLADQCGHLIGLAKKGPQAKAQERQQGGTGATRNAPARGGPAGGGKPKPRPRPAPKSGPQSGPKGRRP